MRATIGVGTPALGILSSKLHSTRPPAAGASGSVGAGVAVLSITLPPSAYISLQRIEKRLMWGFKREEPLPQEHPPFYLISFLEYSLCALLFG